MKRLLTLTFGLATLGCGRTASQPASAIPQIAGKPQTVFALRHVDAVIGTGALVEPRKCLYTHYTGWLTDGKKFDSSRDTSANGTPSAPISFPQGARRVIAGWDIGFEGMRVGGQRRLFIPYQLAYGERGRPPVIPPKAELIFDVELMAIADTLETVAAPPGARAPAGPRCPSWERISRTR